MRREPERWRQGFGRDGPRARRRPESEICWYEGEIVGIGERNARRTVYMCRVMFHADKSRGIFVLNASPETPTKEWDAIRPMPKIIANERKA